MQSYSAYLNQYAGYLFLAWPAGSYNISFDGRHRFFLKLSCRCTVLTAYNRRLSFALPVFSKKPCIKQTDIDIMGAEDLIALRDTVPIPACQGSWDESHRKCIC